jgi:response regulator RpfG family c-di-GMP phosphodiesterase
MTSDRPYRSAHTKDEALIYVRTQAGKHFDPKVVEAFLSVVDSIDAQMDEQ